MDNDNDQIMTLSQTRHHHTAGVNAVALSPDGNRLLSAGKSKWCADIFRYSLSFRWQCGYCCMEHLDRREDASHLYRVPWSHWSARLGSPTAWHVTGFCLWLHQWQHPCISVSSVTGTWLAIIIDTTRLTWNCFQSNYQYFAQELVHGGPIMDIKFDPKFGRLASVGNGFAQVSELSTTEGSEQPLTASWENTTDNSDWMQKSCNLLSPLLHLPSITLPVSNFATMVQAYWFARLKRTKCLYYDSLHRPKCVSHIHNSECFSIQPWVLKWSKQIRTRM